MLVFTVQPVFIYLSFGVLFEEILFMCLVCGIKMDPLMVVVCKLYKVSVGER